MLGCMYVCVVVVKGVTCSKCRVGHQDLEYILDAALRHKSFLLSSKGSKRGKLIFSRSPTVLYHVITGDIGF